MYPENKRSSLSCACPRSQEEEQLDKHPLSLHSLPSPLSRRGQAGATTIIIIISCC
jgi:hypothetical protein